MKHVNKSVACLLIFLWALTSAALAGDEDSQLLRITRSGTETSRQGPADYFTGDVLIEAPFRGDAPARVYGATVVFEPGARSAWHNHALGQTLIVTAGAGLVQRWGGPVETMRRGDVVWIPPNVKHWHGAAPDSAMTHIAIVEHLDGKATEWMEQVSDEQYGIPASRPDDPAKRTEGQTRAQALFGDVAPKLAALTDEVLYADVWERSQLSRRDRSLVTVAALVAMNRPPQLKSHLRLALKNGVTEEELVEAITHLAFYSGWPNAVTAIMTAKEQFGEADGGYHENR